MQVDNMISDVSTNGSHHLANFQRRYRKKPSRYYENRFFLPEPLEWTYLRATFPSGHLVVWAKVMNKGKGLITKHKAFFDIRGD